MTRSRAGSVLSAEQLDAFDRDGVLVLPDFYSGDQCSALQNRMTELVETFDPAVAATVFSTTAASHAQDDWFLTSGDKIRFFFEEGALDDAGELTVPIERGLNKVGHAMHDLDPVFSDFSRTPDMAALAADLGFVDPLLLQSMYIFKQPRIGGEVIRHCDHTFLWTEPQSVMGFWVALEDATENNGCLWYLPGSHHEPARTRFRRAGSGTVTDVLDDAPYKLGSEVALPVSAGTLIVLHGTVTHWSAPNLSDDSRHAWTLHLIDGTADYPDDNWLQRPDLPLRGF